MTRRMRRHLFDFGARHSSGGNPGNFTPGGGVASVSGIISAGTATLPTPSAAGWLWICCFSGVPSFAPNGGWTLKASETNGEYTLYSLDHYTSGSAVASPTNLPNGPYLAAFYPSTVDTAGTKTGSGVSTAPSIAPFATTGYLGATSCVFAAFGVPDASISALPADLVGTFATIDWESTLTLGGGWFFNPSATNTPVQTASITADEAWCTIAQAFS